MQYDALLAGIICLVLGACSITDLLWRKIWIPLLLSAVPGIVVCIVGQGSNVEAHIVCGILCMMGFVGISIVTGGQIEKGDGMVLGVLGLALGLQQLIVFLFFSFTYSFLAAFFLAAVKKKKGSYRMPFIPFAMAGYLTLLTVYG